MMLNLNGNGHKRRSRAQIEKEFAELFNEAPIYPHHSKPPDTAIDEQVVAQVRNLGPTSFRVLRLAVCNRFVEDADVARSVSRLVMMGTLRADGAYPVHYVLQTQ